MKKRFISASINSIKTRDPELNSPKESFGQDDNSGFPLF
jgi:hypothetical protein